MRSKGNFYIQTADLLSSGETDTVDLRQRPEACSRLCPCQHFQRRTDFFHICVLQRKDRKSIAITPCTAEHPMSFKVPDRLLTDGQCRMMINGIQFIQALLEANGLAAGKDHQFKGRYEAEKNAVIISLENDERKC